MRQYISAFFICLGLVLCWCYSAPADDVRRISPEHAWTEHQAGRILLVDIRTPREWADTGVPAGAALITFRSEDDFVRQIHQLTNDQRDTALALICRSGNRSYAATRSLLADGFSNIYDVSEGIYGGRNGPGWIGAGLPLTDAPASP